MGEAKRRGTKEQRVTAHDANDERLAQVRVATGFKLSKASANAWIEAGFSRPG